MPHVRDQARANRAIFTYQLPTRRFAPLIWLWCGVGGLALGVGLALGLVAAGTVTPGSTGFRTFLAGGTLIGALVFYFLIYLITERNQVLEIQFDETRRVLVVFGIGARTPDLYSFDDVLTFRLDRPGDGWQKGCSLIMETKSAGLLVLAACRVRCYEESGLPRLARRLTAHLNAIQEGTGDHPAPPPPPAIGFARPEPARLPTLKSAPSEAAGTPGKRRLPDPHDVQH